MQSASFRTRLAGRVVLITGASRGLGRATAELFTREGARLVLCARSRRPLESTRSAILRAGGDAIARPTDISSPSEVRVLIQAALRRYGHLDVLINNAGILGPRVPVTDYPLRDWSRTVHINLTGTFVISREVARVMVRQRQGCIITVSSSVGRVGRARWGAYAVSKFGVEGLMQVLADELRPFGVHALCFNPGRTRTRMRAEAYPDEDPNTVPPPSVPADGLLRLVERCTRDLSGKTFDLDTLP